MYYDVIILGGGPAGAATALSLRAHAPHLSVAIIEQSSYEETRIGETIPPTAQTLLEKLGVWQTFLRQKHVAAYGTCAAWGSNELHEHEFIFHPAGRGWHLDRRRFDLMLVNEAVCAGATLLHKSKFVSSEIVGDKEWQLKIISEDITRFIRTNFVVDATGRHGALATRHDAQRIVSDQLLGAFVFFEFEPAAPLDTYTLVEACEEGWWYSALVPDGKVAVAFMSDNDVVKRLRLTSLTSWLDLVKKTGHTYERLQDAAPLNHPLIYPAASGRLDRITGPEWLAVGDAASTFDPLSSAGIMKGLRSGILASYAISDYLAGEASSLQKYEALLTQEFEKYLVTRATFYRQERRWPESAFWRRRHNEISADERVAMNSATSALWPARDNKSVLAGRGANHIQPV